MSAQTQGTTSSDLLWGYQLKLQHAHLLSRVNELTSSNKSLKERLETTESHLSRIKSSTEVKQLSLRLADCENNGKELRNSIAEVRGQHDAVKTETESQIRQVEQEFRHMQDESKQPNEALKEYVAQIEAIALRMDKIEDLIQSGKLFPVETVSKKTDIDVKVVSRRLEAVEAQRTRDGFMIKALADKITALERTNDRLLEENKNLKSDFRPQNGGPRYEQPVVNGKTPQPLSSPCDAQPTQTPLVEKQARKNLLERQEQAKQIPRQSPRNPGIQTRSQKALGSRNNNTSITGKKTPSNTVQHSDLPRAYAQASVTETPLNQPLYNRGVKRAASPSQRSDPKSLVQNKKDVAGKPLENTRPVKYRRRIIVQPEYTDSSDDD